MYLSTMGSVTNVNVIGNYMEGAHNAAGDANASCMGSMLTAHGGITNLNITDNTLVQTASRTVDSCYGIS